MDTKCDSVIFQMCYGCWRLNLSSDWQRCEESFKFPFLPKHKNIHTSTCSFLGSNTKKCLEQHGAVKEQHGAVKTLYMSKVMYDTRG